MALNRDSRFSSAKAMRRALGEVSAPPVIPPALLPVDIFDTIEMVEIPAGKFLMGSPDSEADRYADEGPQHEVRVSSFYMGKYQVTQAEWRAVAALSKMNRDLNPDPSHFKGDDLPIESVSWEEAVEFCERLSKATRKTYRLPTEAEWEYACRARTKGPYSGNLDSMAWYSNNSEDKTHAVGTKQPNGFGLYDMHGNVWEWCMDWYSENYFSQSASVDPTGPSTGSDRVGRGGSWLDVAVSCRSAYRAGFAPGFRAEPSRDFATGAAHQYVDCVSSPTVREDLTGAIEALADARATDTAA